MAAVAQESEVELLKACAKELRPKLAIQDRRWHMKNYRKCFVGSESVPMIIDCGFASNESEAVNFGNKLMNAGIIQHVEEDHNFKNERLFYRFKPGVLKGAKSLEDIVKRRLDSVESASGMRSKLIRQITDTNGLYETHNESDPDIITPQHPSDAVVTLQTNNNSNDSNHSQTQNGINAQNFQYSNHSSVHSPHSQQSHHPPPASPHSVHSNKYTNHSPHGQHSPYGVGSVVSPHSPSSHQSPRSVHSMHSAHSPPGSVTSMHSPKSQHSPHSQQIQQNQHPLFQAQSHQNVHNQVIIGMQHQIQSLFRKLQHLETLYLNNHQSPNQRVNRGDTTATVSTEGRSSNVFETGDIDNFDILNMDQIPKMNVVDKTPNLQKPWRHYDEHCAQFRVDKIGRIVYLQGTITGGNVDEIICILPKDCRPSGVMVFVFDQNGDSNGKLKVLPDGHVIVKRMNQEYVYLDGISFISSIEKEEEEEVKEDVDGVMDLTPKLENGWIEFGGGYADFKVFSDSNMVQCQGAIKGGKSGISGFICRLPEQCRPSGLLTFCFDQNGKSNGRIRVQKDGVVYVENMNGNVVYLDTVSFVVR